MTRDSLILIPGMKADARLWAPQVEALMAERDVTVPTAHMTAPTIEAMAEAILSIAPPRFDLAGQSMGGYVAFAILRQAPERVRRVAFVDTSARPEAPEVTERRLRLINVARERGMTVASRATLGLDVYQADDRPDVVAALIAMSEDIGFDTYLSQQQAVMGRADSRPGLAAIACPTAVICGADDNLTPPELSREIAGGIQGATLDLIPRCGHCAPIEQPAAVTAVMRAWLARPATN